MAYLLGQSAPIGRGYRNIRGNGPSFRSAALLALLGLPLLLFGCQYIEQGWDAIKRGTMETLAQGDKGRLPDPFRAESEKISRLPKGILPPGDAFADSPSVTVHHARFSSQDSAYAVLAANGLSRREIWGILRAAKSVRSLSRIGVGNRYELAAGSGGFRRFLVQLDDERQLRVYRTVKGSLRARLERIPYQVDNVRLKMKIRGTLFGTVSRAGAPLSVAMKLNEIFEWVVDFHKDVKEGDEIDLLVEKRSLRGRPAGLGRILAANVTASGKTHAAILFRVGRDSYFTPEGKTLRRAFLRSPLKYTRISSRFTAKRFHPVLKRFRPHLGVDYAAPKGTPVRAVADGQIMWAGWKGAAGKTVQLRHGRGYVTSYLHLSRIGRGVRRGRQVRQGQVVGYVGSTGLSTGPHLDFRIKRNGTPINPLSARLPAGNPVPSARRAEFQRVVKSMSAQLAAPPFLGRSSDVASARPGNPVF